MENIDFQERGQERTSGVLLNKPVVTTIQAIHENFEKQSKQHAGRKLTCRTSNIQERLFYH